MNEELLYFYIKAYKNNKDINAKEKLISYYKKYITKQIHINFNNIIDNEELLQLTLTNLLEKIETLDLKEHNINDILLQYIDELLINFILDNEETLNEIILKLPINNFKNINTFLKNLSYREKMILFLRYTKDKYSYEKIGNELQCSPSTVARILKNTILKINPSYKKKEKLQNEEKFNKITTTIYDYFKFQTKEEVDNALLLLSEDERNIIESKSKNQLKKNQIKEFYNSILPKLNRIILNKDPKEEERLKILSKLDNPFFKKLESVFPTKEAILLFLNLGYAGKEYSSIEFISEFLKTPKEELLISLKEAKRIYKRIFEDTINKERK